VTVDEAQEAPDVVIGIFSVNSTTAIVLFDSGASHSFISVAYVEKHNIPDVRLVPNLLGGRGRLTGGDLDIGEEGSEHMIVTLQSLQHGFVGFQHAHT
jgi:hypothetical protein